jgi:hypothetical protein
MDSEILRPRDIKTVNAYLSELDGDKTTFKEKQQLFNDLLTVFKKIYSRRVIKAVANKCDDFESGKIILELIEFLPTQA